MSETRFQQTARQNAQQNEPPAITVDEIVAQFESLQQENEALGRELLRCYEQLSLVFEITEHIGKLEDPEHIQVSLLQRFGAMLGAGAIYVVRDGECEQIKEIASMAAPIRLPASLVKDVFAEEIAAVRETRRARVPAISGEMLDKLNENVFALLVLMHVGQTTSVIIALRGASEANFDSGDMLVSESVLGYGGHILNNVYMVRRLEQTAIGTVRALANAIDAKDNYTCGHSERVGWLARMTGRALGLSQEELQALEWAGLLHDVGKIGIPERILNKPGKLTEDEFGTMKRHPSMSYEVLKPVESLGPALEAVLYHHENWNGSGYPEGRSGEAIPLSARIIHVVDVFDALTSTRSYRKAFGVERAIGILEEEAGRATDPHVTSVFIDTFRAYMRYDWEDFCERFAHVPDAEQARPEMPASENGATSQANTNDGDQQPDDQSACCGECGRCTSVDSPGEERSA